MSRFRAQLILTWYFILSLLSRLAFWRRRQAINDWLAWYRTDGVLAVSESERARLATFQRCIDCSLCTFSCSAVSEGRAPSAFEPKYILLAYARSSREAEIYREQWLPCAECRQCTVECPNEVPIHAVIDLIGERRREVGFREPSGIERPAPVQLANKIRSWPRNLTS